jgi:hypothetical protein
MHAYIVSDADFATQQFRSAVHTLKEFLHENGFAVEQKSVARGELKNCVGCFGCWIQTPGECVMHDAIAEINSRSIQSDVTVYLCPIIFGQFSANMKNVIDRWLPNMLPYFITRSDGSSMHPARYASYPKQIMIGYGEHLEAEDETLFCDITQKHRSGIETLIWQNAERLKAELSVLKLERMSGSL